MKALIGLIAASLIMNGFENVVGQDSVFVAPKRTSFQFFFNVIGAGGTSINVLRLFNSSNALRLGWSSSFYKNNRKATYELIPTDTSSQNLKNRWNESNFNVFAQYFHRFSLDHKTNLFFGIGPQVRWLRYKYRDEYYYNYLDQYKGQVKQWSVGLLASMNAEWFAMERLSLLAEYNLSLFFDRSKDKRSSYNGWDQTTRKSTSKGHGISFTQNMVRFGMAIHF